MRKDIFIVGMALFAMFFGAGNIVFPPYLGLGAGPEWFVGFVAYYFADIGLALIAIFAMLRSESSSSATGILHRLGPIPALIMMTAVIICIGPLVAIPRTAATAFEISSVPFTGDAAAARAIFSIIYFALVFVFTIRETKMVEIIGKYLTPLLLLGLLAVIAKGIISPIAPISDVPLFSEATPPINVIGMGLESGYQTLDVMAALIYGFVIVNAMRAKGYETRSQKIVSVGGSSIVAGVLLLVVYGGLCYLGATVSTIYGLDIDEGILVSNIVGHLYGGTSVGIAGFLVLFACLTTAIALVGTAGAFFSTVTRGRISYEAVVIIVCVFSAIFSNIGLSAIISFAAPILGILYPGVLVVVILSLFDKQIKNDNIFKVATLAAIIVSNLDMFFPAVTSFLPLQEIGLSWVVPAIFFAVIGYFIKPKETMHA